MAALLCNAFQLPVPELCHKAVQSCLVCEHAVTAAAGLLQDVSTRYGHPVVVLNLVKSAEKRPRETILRKEFAISIAYINQQV